MNREWYKRVVKSESAGFNERDRGGRAWCPGTKIPAPVCYSRSAGGYREEGRVDVEEQIEAEDGTIIVADAGHGELELTVQNLSGILSVILTWTQVKALNEALAAKLDRS